MIYQPVIVLGDTVYFDADGNTVEQAQYEQTALDQEKYIGMKLKNGYNPKNSEWKDPIKLRKKRIEQWKTMRSHYHPDSLPSKIEKRSNFMKK
jgi:hypothetical protein